MSLKNVQAAVERFLRSDPPQAIAISGRWGSGKTYFWREYIKEASKEGLVKKYSYVSLFGVNNLGDLKSTIFDNAVPAKDVEEGASSTTWAENAKEALKAMDTYRLEEVKKPLKRLVKRVWRTFSPVIPPLSTWAGFARSLSFLAIRDYVICLDDVERKGDGLSLKEILGLASMLKEQRGCRVIIILNEDELGEEKSALDGFKEKVFDNEIVFSPSVNECAQWVFDNDWAYSKEVLGKVDQLGIKNIRVMQRIRRVIETFLPYLRGKDEMLTSQLIHSSVLLTWCYHSRGNNIPLYSMVKDSSVARWAASADKKEEESKEKELTEKVLSSYGYRDSDEFDLHICQFIENGYIEEDDFIAVVNSFQELALKNKHSGSFTDAWSLFHDTFSNNEDGLVSTLRQRFLDGAKWITLNNAMATVKLIRELGHDDVADELMGHWIEMARSANRELLNLGRAHLFEGSVDKKFVETVKVAYAKDAPVPTLAGIIKSVADRSGWSKEDIDFLAENTSDDYYKFFKSFDIESHLDNYVKACLQFGSYHDDDGRYKKIYDASSDALRKIASESHLNKVRVARYLTDVPARN
jgi:hypothetical protein